MFQNCKRCSIEQVRGIRFRRLFGKQASLNLNPAWQFVVRSLIDKPFYLRNLSIYCSGLPLKEIFDYRNFAPVSVLVALFSYNSLKVLNCSQGVHCVSEYWAMFWTMSYSGGYERRAFLGSVLELFTGDEIAPLTLNLIALSATALLVSGSVLLISKFGGHWKPALVAAFAVGPSMTVMLETTGDPLQIAAIAILVCALPARNLAAILAFFLIPISILIHEAAIFIYLPVLLLIIYQSVGREPRLLEIWLTTIGFVLISILVSDQSEAVANNFVLMDSGEKIKAQPNALPGFRELLAIEFSDRFGTLGGFAKLVKDAVGAILWPTLFFTVLSLSLGNIRPLKLFLFLLIVSLPLYAIAHDWGRFVIHTAVGAIVLTVRELDSSFGRLDVKLSALLERSLRTFKQNIGFEIAIICLFTYQAHRAYRIGGLTFDNVVILISLIVLAMLGKRLLTKNSTD